MTECLLWRVPDATLTSRGRKGTAVLMVEQNAKQALAILHRRVRARAGPEPRRRNGARAARRSRGARRLPQRLNVYRSSVGLRILAKTFRPTRPVRASPIRGPSKEEDR